MKPSFPGWIVTAAVIVAGCSNSPSRLVPPKVNPAAGEAAIKQYDANGDASLSAAELEKSPPLKSAVARLDKNRDGRLTADEINGRIDEWRKTRVALTTVVPSIRLDGRPLSGAQVTLAPEEFLGESIEPARGTTNERGIARLKISDQPDEAGVRLGFYRIRVSKTENGKEIVPARYNSQSEIGIEVASDVFDTRNPNLNLSSK